MLKSLIIIVAAISLSDAALADPLRDQIERLEARWMDAYQRGDSKAAAALVSADVVVINAEGKSIGSGAYAALIERDAKMAKLSIQIDDVQPLGENAAMATGNYVANVEANKGAWLEQGHWLRLYARDGNSWKIRASSFSVKEPPTTIITVR